MPVVSTYFCELKGYKLCANGLSKLETMESLVTEINVENKNLLPIYKNTCIY